MPTIDIGFSADPISVGEQIGATVTLSGGDHATGSIQFTLFGPADPSCSGPPASTAAVAVSGNNDYAPQPNPFTASAAGTYHVLAGYGGDANNAPVATACDNGPVTAVMGPTIVAMSPVGLVSVGEQIASTVTLSGGNHPTGSIQFTLFGPTDPTCSGTPESTATAPVSGNNDYAPQGNPFTASALGTYRVVAAYSGDASNAPFATPCDEGPTTIAEIATATSPAVAVGGSISATATLNPSDDPSASVSFDVYGPADRGCIGRPAFTVSPPITGNRATSGMLTPAVPGVYNFVVTYSLDATTGVRTSCGAPGTSVTVGLASPVVAATASGPVPVGGAISGTATLSGGSNPTGTIRFMLFGPSDPSCTGAPEVVVTAGVSGGRATSGQLATTATGNYHFVAAYSGDANNAGATTTCGAAAVAAGVTRPSIRGTASASTASGGQIADTAILTGAYSPRGTITFTLFGPGNPTCKGTPAFRVIAPVTAGGASSNQLTAAGPGRYDFVLAYSGDANNAPASSSCGANSVILGTAAQVSQRAARASARGVTLTLACAARPSRFCRGKAKLTTREKLRGRQIAGLSALRGRGNRTRTVGVGQTTYKIAAGRTATIKVRLDNTGRRLQKTFRVLPVRLTLTITRSAGHDYTVAVTRLRLRAP